MCVNLLRVERENKTSRICPRSINKNIANGCLWKEEIRVSFDYADQFSKPIITHQAVQTGITLRIYIMSASSTEIRTIELVDHHI
jgi:hypothetical protein